MRSDLFSPEHVALVAKERDTILLKHDVSNGPNFGVRARKFIADYLLEHGPTPGEVLVNACLAADIKPSGDARAFGSSFMSLLRREIIIKVADCKRMKGHLTSGGAVYALKSKVVEAYKNEQLGTT